MKTIGKVIGAILLAGTLIGGIYMLSQYLSSGEKGSDIIVD